MTDNEKIISEAMRAVNKECYLIGKNYIMLPRDKWTRLRDAMKEYQASMGRVFYEIDEEFLFRGLIAKVSRDPDARKIEIV
jgi:hypothetical protein